MTSPIRSVATDGLPVGKVSFILPTQADNTAMVFGPDRTSGAPASIRAAVAGAHTPIDKLRTLRTKYPDARPYEDGNFIYTDLVTGKPTVFDESQPTARDLIDMAPGAAEMGGALAGGAAGFASGGPLGAMAGSGLAATGGREVVERLLRGIFGGQDSRTAGQQLGDAATTAGANAVGEGVARGTMAGVSALGKTIGTVTRGTANAAEREVLDAGRLLNIPIPKAINTRSKILNFLSDVERRNPLTSQIMANGAQDTRQALARASKSLGNQISGGQAVGHQPFLDRLRDASEDVIQRFKTTRNGMDDALQQYMDVLGPDARVPVPNAISKLAEMQAIVARSPQLEGPRYAPAMQMLQQVIDDASGGVQQLSTQVPNPLGAVNNAGQPLLSQALSQVQARPQGVPFDVLRKIRSDVGDLVNWSSPLERPDPSQKLMGEVFDALRSDIKNAATMADAKLGTTEASDALKLHDDYVHLSRSSKELVNLDTFRKINEEMKDKRPVEWALSVSRDREGPAKMGKILGSFSPAERQAIAGSIFEDMGTKPGSDAFDPTVFFNNWNKMGHVRNEIFGQSSFRGTLPSLQALATVASKGKEISRFADQQQSGLFGLGLGAVVGIAAKSHPVIAGLGGVSALTAAKLLSNPEWARWAASAAKGTTWTAAQGARLEAIKKVAPGIRNEIDQYTGVLKQAGAAFPDPASTNHLNGQVGTTYEPL